MPRLSCWFLRAALIHLAVGGVVGGLLLSAKGMPTEFGWAWLLLSAHIQLLIGGWLIQLALGMAYWIVPRLNGTGDRGRPIAAVASFALLNAGVGGAATALLLRSWIDAPWLDGALILSALLQVIALGAFARHVLPRLAAITQPSI